MPCEWEPEYWGSPHYPHADTARPRYTPFHKREGKKKRKKGRKLRGREERKEKEK